MSKARNSCGPVHNVLAATALVALIVASSCGTHEAEQTKLAVSKGNCFICILDVSASMTQNDKHGFAEQAAQMAISLLNEDTSFAAVAFSSEARVVCDWHRIGSGQTRSALQKKVSGLVRRGGTNFIAALEKARELARRTSTRGAVLFLTDGEHKEAGRLDKVREEVAFFASRGWPIYTVGLSRKADATMLQEMAARTGGAYFRVDEPEQLLAAFVDIVSVTEGLFVRRGPFSPVTVMPGTSRLIYLAARKGPDAKIADAKLNGAAHRAADVHRFPSTKQQRAAVDILCYERPGSGLWEVQASGAVGDCAILIKPPLTVDIAPGEPRPKYVDGQTVSLGLLARSDVPELLAGLRINSRVTAKIRSETTGALSEPLELAAQEAPEAPVVFRGNTVAKLSEPGKTETMTANLSCALAWASGEEWIHEKIVSYQVVPAEGLFEARPKNLDFGWLWSDSEGERRKFSILSRQDESVFAISSGMSELSFEPERLTLQTAEEREIAGLLKPTGQTKPGELSGEAVVSLDIGDVSGRRYEERLGISAKVLRFIGGDLIELPNTMPGNKAKVELTHKTEPEEKLVWPGEVKLSCIKLGPDQIPTVSGKAPESVPSVMVTLADTGLGVVEMYVDVPEELPAGLYEGELVVETANAALKRKLRVLLPVGKPQPAIVLMPEEGDLPLAKLELAASRAGWSEVGFDVVAKHISRGELTYTSGALKGERLSISPRFNIAFVPQEGWGGKDVLEGFRYGLRYRVYVSTDLVDGEYRGELSFCLISEGKQVAELKVPVVLTVKLERGLDVPPPKRLAPPEPTGEEAPRPASD